MLAIGSPFGLNQTVTHGIISARERGQVSLGTTIRIKDFLQTDAAINPGSSGGPLVNLNGEVIGVNTAIASHSGSNSGVAFSIPVNLVKRVVGQLLEKGNVSRGYLGMQLAQSFEPADAVKLGLDRVQGALVETVYTGTPAASAGLRANDVVLQIDNFAVRNENQLINSVSAMPVGQKIRLQVWRDRKIVTLEAVIGDWSQGQTRCATNPDEAAHCSFVEHHIFLTRRRSNCLISGSLCVQKLGAHVAIQHRGHQKHQAEPDQGQHAVAIFHLADIEDRDLEQGSAEQTQAEIAKESCSESKARTD